MNNLQQEEENRETVNLEKMKISGQFMTAMFSPREYRGSLLKLPMKKVVSYFLCLILLLTVIQCAIPTVGAIAGMGGFRKIIMERVPDFELKDGTLFFDERFKLDDEESGIYVLIDTNEETFTKEDAVVNTTFVESILVSRTNVIVSNMVPGMGTMSQEYKLSDFGDLHLTNETLADMEPFYYVMMFFMYIVAYALMGMKYMFSALIYAAFMFFMTKMMMLDVTFGDVYKVAMYANTIGSIVEAVTYCIGNPMLMMAGSIFHVFVTLSIMNRVYVRTVIV
ncbi:MAG: DUF1189 domain-containing protein [Clostridiales bacterium]|nr:DUF1189 domain-containing protein [Clostridiales bacterium]